MVNEVQYVSINRVLDNLKDGVLMQDLTLEQAIRHIIRFIGKVGIQKMYEDKIAEVDIHDFRGLLPCDCIRILQVRDLRSGTCVRSMTDNFSEGFKPNGSRPKPCKDPMHNMRDMYIPEPGGHPLEPTFKTNNRVIFTSFPDGRVEIAYKAIAVDDNGFPLLIDDEIYLDALEKYIVMHVLQQKFRVGKTSAGIYQDAQQDYYAAVKLLEGHLKMPTESELESIAHIWNTMIPSHHHFQRGYKELGEREYLRRH